MSASSTRRSNSAARIVSPPTTSGSSAATTLRKTNSAIRNSAGKASASGAREVPLHLVVDLHDRDRRPADGGARHRLQPPVDALGRLPPALLGDAATREGGNDGLAAIP